MRAWMGVGTALAVFFVCVALNSVLSRSQSYNSLGQNPCEIAGSLQAPCLGYCTHPIRLRLSLKGIDRINAYSRLRAWTAC